MGAHQCISEWTVSSKEAIPSLWLERCMFDTGSRREDGLIYAACGNCGHSIVAVLSLTCRCLSVHLLYNIGLTLTLCRLRYQFKWLRYSVLDVRWHSDHALAVDLRFPTADSRLLPRPQNSEPMRAIQISPSCLFETLVADLDQSRSIFLSSRPRTSFLSSFV